MMTMTPQQAQLSKENEALRQKLEAAMQQLAASQQENKLLREKVDALVRRIFGPSSEKMDDAQLMLALQGDEAKKPAASTGAHVVLEAEIERLQKKDAQEARRVTTKPARASREPRVPEHLPVSERIEIDPEEVKADPAAWRHIPGGELITTQLDYTPGRYSQRLIVRRRYARRDAPHQPPIAGELPTLADKSIASPGLLASIIVGKYCDHLPLYRQEQIARTRHGIELPRQSMARWLQLAADWLKPLYTEIQSGVMSGGYVEVDETVIKYLKPGHGETKQGYFWSFKRPGGDAFFAWRTGRGTEHLADILTPDFSGVIGCDGYAAYQNHAARNEGRIRLAACWAHVRRKFKEAQQSGSDSRAGLILIQIRNLYRIEARLRQQRAGPRQRKAVRQYESAPILGRIEQLLKAWSEGKHGREIPLPQSLLGKAIAYTQGLWSELSEYIGNGRVEIDNNLVENAIRPTAVGKKNWMFIGDELAGETSAVLYTIIESCRGRGLDPWSYLKEVLTHLPKMKSTQVKDITPAKWQSTQRQLARRAA